MNMDFEDTLDQRLKDPEFCRALLDELRKTINENERMRESLEAIRQWTVAWTWKDEVIAKCFMAAKEGLDVAEVEQRHKALDEATKQAQDLDMGY